MLVIICLSILAVVWSEYILKLAVYIVRIAIELTKLPWQLAVSLAKVPLAQSFHIVFTLAGFALIVYALAIC